jgi:adenylate cyclase
MATDAPSRPNRSFALMPTLVTSIGLLVLCSVGAVLLVNWIADRRVVREFASALVLRVLGGEEVALRSHLDEAVQQGNYIAAAISSGRYKLSDPALADFLGGTFAAAPQIDGLILGDGNGGALRAVRGASDGQARVDRFDVAADSQIAALGETIRLRKEPFWGEPVYLERRGDNYLNYRVPIWNGDSYLGFVALGISTQALSKLVNAMSHPPTSLSFMLYAGNRLLAHPLMVTGSRDRPVTGSLPTLRTFGDRVIADIENLPDIREAGLTPPVGVFAREASVDGEPYFVFAREITDYNELPITVGVYFLKHAVDGPVRVLYSAAMLALAMLGASLIAAAVMAGAISRPIRRAAKGATAIGNLDFAQVAPLSGSYIREINSLATAFNAMLDGLRAFGRYVPHTLVSRLVKEGRIGAGTEERVLAIMFTDIVSFTPTCEAMTAGDVAAFVNAHLSLIAACVEREGGTIDKFIGDAVMAFWGAPGRLDNPAAAACRAAVAIQNALAADNQRRAGEGLAPIRIRIGIHMGPVIVGDIGAPNRINYTIVGDAVNATQRLESLGKTVDARAEAIVLVSREIHEAAPAGFQFIELGSRLVKGKQESIEVYRLIGGPDASASRATATMADVNQS